MSRERQLGMIGPGHSKLSLSRQCALLGIALGGCAGLNWFSLFIRIFAFSFPSFRLPARRHFVSSRISMLGREINPPQLSLSHKPILPIWTRDHSRFTRGGYGTSSPLSSKK